jgi:hypothetical protein
MCGCGKTKYRHGKQPLSHDDRAGRWEDQRERRATAAGKCGKFGEQEMFLDKRDARGYEV